MIWLGSLLAMKVMLTQKTAGGCVDIGKAPDGRFHVLWRGESLGSADSIPGAMGRASRGPLKKPIDGTDVTLLGVSRNDVDWTAVERRNGK